MISSATVNLLLSFVLFPVFDITGALIATVVAHCIMWAGRIVVVFRRYMQGSMGHYLCMQGLHLVTLAACLGGTWTVCKAVPLGGWLGLLPRAVIVCVVPNLINLVVYAWGSDAAYLREYAARVLRTRRNRL